MRGMNWEERSWEGRRGEAATNTWGVNAISSVKHLMCDSRSSKREQGGASQDWEGADE